MQTLDTCILAIGDKLQWWWFLAFYVACVVFAAITWMVLDEIQFRRHRRETLRRLNEISNRKSR